MDVSKLTGGSVVIQPSLGQGVRSVAGAQSVEQGLQGSKERETSHIKDSYGLATKEEVQQVVDEFNEVLEPIRRNLKFELHDKLNQYYVTVVDSNTDEVIKEIPPKKMLDVYAAMAELMGFLVDERV